MGALRGKNFEWIRKCFILILTLCLAVGTASPVLASQKKYQARTQQTITYGQTGTSQNAVKVLLVGNSFTQRNNLAEMLQKIAESRGDQILVSALVKGETSLSDFADQGSQLGKRLRRLLENEKWDYVILQDRRFRPLKDADGMEKDVKKLCRLIKKAGAAPMLYMTWAPQSWHSDYQTYSALVSNRMDYQRKVSETCRKIAEDTGAKLIPAGTAVMRAEKKLPKLSFEDWDGYHPNRRGSYVVACTMYSILTGKSAYGSDTYTAGLSRKTAQQLQHIAWYVASHSA